MTFRRLIVALLLAVLTAGLAHAATDDYVNDINIFASKKFGDFKAELSAHYGISGSRFDLMLQKLDSPGDLAVAAWLSAKSYRSIDDVTKQYRIHKGKGWGVIARGLGIKPGSPAFKQLKAGTLGWYPKEFDTVMKDYKMEKAMKRKEKKKKEKKQ
jgi:hypothetical protein